MCGYSHNGVFYIAPRKQFIKAASQYWDEPEAFKVLIDHFLLAVYLTYIATSESTAWKKIIPSLNKGWNVRLATALHCHQYGS